MSEGAHLQSVEVFFVYILSCVSYFSQQSLMFLFLVHIVFFQPGEGKGSARLSCPGNTTAAITAVDVVQVTPTTIYTIRDHDYQKCSVLP